MNVINTEIKFENKEREREREATVTFLRSIRAEITRSNFESATRVSFVRGEAFDKPINYKQNVIKRSCSSAAMIN